MQSIVIFTFHTFCLFGQNFLFVVFKIWLESVDVKCVMCVLCSGYSQSVDSIFKIIYRENLIPFLFEDIIKSNFV